MIRGKVKLNLVVSKLRQYKENLFMKCNKCKTEFEGRFCPNCGNEAFKTNSASTTADQQSQQTYFRQYNQAASNNSVPMKKKKSPYIKGGGLL